jgi:phage terminase Nu1 subunit (DNA packaging protein)
MLARLLGVHADTISDYTRNGMPVLEPGDRGKPGRYDAIACAAWWRIRRGGTLDAEKARALRAQAEQGELRLAERRKQLVAREEVIREGTGFVKAVRARLLAMSRRLAQLGLVSPEQEPAVRALVLETLRELAGWSVAQVHAVLATADKEPAE